MSEPFVEEELKLVSARDLNRLAAEIERLRATIADLEAALSGMIECYGDHADEETADVRAEARASLIRAKGGQDVTTLKEMWHRDDEVGRLAADNADLATENARLRSELHSVHAHLQHYRTMLDEKRATIADLTAALERTAARVAEINQCHPPCFRCAEIASEARDELARAKGGQT